MNLQKQLILASQSPRRKQLLEQAELSFTIKTVHTAEDYPDELSSEQVPLHIARHKADAVFESIDTVTRSNAIVLAADTVVVLDGKIIGKPRDEQDAVAMLRELSGKIHSVITGVVLQTAEQTIAISECTEVHFLPLTTAQIEHYVTQYKPLDKAGSYAIQEWIGLTGIEKINGDFYNVMGLPVNKVVQALRSL